jgi:type VI secretion system protein ImpF
MQGSILDRLIDMEPDKRGEPVQYHSASYSQIRGSIERDLENLLNTRCFSDEIPNACSELRKSLLMYGLPDFTSKNPSTPSVRTELRQELERAISMFEPRLHNVSVRIENPTSGERRLKFKIMALLRIDDADAESVSFDTFFDSNRGEYSISNQR